jgi:hypothetical protein
MITVTRTIDPPPPNPCTTLPARSETLELANAATRLPTINMVTAAIIVGFLPKISESLTQTGVDAVVARV